MTLAKTLSMSSFAQRLGTSRSLVKAGVVLSCSFAKRSFFHFNLIF